MAITIQCEWPGYTKAVLGDDRNKALQFLMLHDTQALRIANKP